MSPDELYKYQVRGLKEYAMFMIGPDGRLLSWNSGVERLLGYTEQEWIGLHGSVIFTPPQNAEEVFETEMQRAREFGFSTDIRWHVKKDGSLFFANGFMNLITDDKGEVLGFAKIVNDETDRKRLQDALTESNIALEQFAMVASHDLQEPLRTISVMAEVVRQRYADTLCEEAGNHLAAITAASTRMRSLIQDLLAWSISATQVDRPMSVALDEDLEAAVSHLSEAIAESGGNITHDALPVLAVDRGRMVRLFQNLIGNALKYRKPDVPPNVHVSAELSGSDWIFSVRDNGIGFDPQYAVSIFEPLKRLHPGSEYPGTGIGLAICKRIVEAHGGRIWATSEKGVGSTFFFTIPASLAKEASG